MKGGPRCQIFINKQNTHRNHYQNHNHNNHNHNYNYHHSYSNDHNHNHYHNHNHHYNYYYHMLQDTSGGRNSNGCVNKVTVGNTNPDENNHKTLFRPMFRLGDLP